MKPANSASAERQAVRLGVLWGYRTNIGIVCGMSYKTIAIGTTTATITTINIITSTITSAIIPYHYDCGGVL